MKIFAGADIGGTTTKVGVVRDGKLELVSFATPHDKDALFDGIADASFKLARGNELCGVGVGVPGMVKDGIASFMPNLRIGKLDAAREVEERLGVPSVAANDADVAALGECKAAGLSDAVMLTLGTGVGGGIVIGGKIYSGPLGGAGELGHMIVKVGGRKCGCGQRGCLEAYVSATALDRDVKRALARENTLMNELNCDFAMRPFEAERLGDASAKRIVERYIEFLSVGILNICNIFRPQAVIIGGGVANQGENLIGRVREYCRKFDFGYKFAPAPAILQSKLKMPGVYGAIELIEYSAKGDQYERFKRN